MFKPVSAILILSILLIAPAFGQSDPASAPGAVRPDRQSLATSAVHPEPLRVTNLLGATVLNSDREVVGVINDLVLDAQGRTRTAVIGLGGFLGLGEKDVAVPFTDLSLSVPDLPSGVPQFPNSHYGGSSPERVILPLSFRQLSDAPAFRTRGMGGPSNTGGTPEGTSKEPKSSTQSGGPG
jgi:sporulation protein YlmC with PRC-barrel domain